MELNTLIKELRKNSFLVVVFAIIGVVLAVGYNSLSKQKTFYKASYPLYIKTIPLFERSQWHDVTDSVIGILKFKLQSLPDGTVEIQKATTGLIILSVIHEDESTARDKLNNYFNQSNQALQDLTVDEQFQLSLVKVTDKPQMVINRPSPILNLIVGGLLGWLVGIMIVFLKLYFR